MPQLFHIIYFIQLIPYCLFHMNDVGVKKYFAPMIPTDCYALCALAILKHSKSALIGLLSHVCGSPSHTFSWEHEKYDLLTLVSYELFYIEYLINITSSIAPHNHISHRHSRAYFPFGLRHFHIRDIFCPPVSAKP